MTQPLALTDSEMEIVSDMAAPLPPSQRSAFLEALAVALSRYPAEARGPGLVHRVGREVQYGFVKDGPVAVGSVGKYGRPPAVRQAAAKSAR